MSDIIKLLENNIVSTVNGLTGEEPRVELDGAGEITGTSIFEMPLAVISVEVGGDLTSKCALLISAHFASAVADMMLGGEGDTKDQLDSEDIDATKEVVSNIFGSLSTDIGAQPDLPNLTFGVPDAAFVLESDALNIADYKNFYQYKVALKENESKVYFLHDGALSGAASGSEPLAGSGESVSEGTSGSSNPKLSDDELKNIGLILDVKLPVKVRIGSKKLLLKDVLTMDIGSVIELNQLANEPLDILIGSKVIAKGEVVIVDGNFGVQVTEVISQRERLAQLS
jgi:flagellar motor switch protein FliN/FliY